MEGYPMKKIVLATVAVMMLAPTSIALADDSKAALSDQIILSVTKDGWVTTNSARVFVGFEITQQKETASELKEQIMSSLKKLSAETDWHITSSRENKDRTGLTRWSVAAEARVAENAIAGLADRAEAAGRPGFKMTVRQVDYSPSLAETEKLKSDLRAKIYAAAVDEANRLTKVIPNRSYRIQMVDFQNIGYQPPQMMKMMARPAAPRMEMDASSANAGGGNGAAELAVSRRHSMSATIILTSDKNSDK
ncbi:MAG: hypothetical protein ACJAYR_003363 [Sneathiella sp.]|jgi:uncharacterized protein YggE